MSLRSRHAWAEAGEGRRLGRAGVRAVPSRAVPSRLGLPLREVLCHRVGGAAAAAGNILGLDARTIEQAFGIAGSSAAGLFAFLSGGGEIKRLHPGMAAREGVLAALLAQRGMTGPVGVLEAEDGFFQAYSGTRDLSAVTAGLTDRTTDLNITRCYLKPYPCFRHLHPGIDGLRQIMADAVLAPDAIARVDVGTYGVAVSHAGSNTGNMAAAQMSYPYCMAVALQRGDVVLDDFTSAARADPSILDAMQLIHVDQDAECEATYPSVRPARVRVTTTDGAVLERMIDEPSGSARSPLNDDAVESKFRSLVAPVLGHDAADRLIAMIGALEDQADVDSVLSGSARP